MIRSQPNLLGYKYGYKDTNYTCSHSSFWELFVEGNKELVNHVSYTDKYNRGSDHVS